MEREAREEAGNDHDDDASDERTVVVGVDLSILQPKDRAKVEMTHEDYPREIVVLTGAEIKRAVDFGWNVESLTLLEAKDHGRSGW